MREFWWYTIHVLTLMTAFVFMLGGIYVVRMYRESDTPWTLEIKLHVYLGYIVILSFAMHLVFGFFRAWKTKYRILQILLHWLFGMFEYMFGGKLRRIMSFP